ncbi:MAG: hypothetical protein R3309_13565 [Reinekea sp.]|jgi:heme-degrading monooxygenase HmoA|nr:hypothetical protein [Reinekea sp.]MDX1475194.1 hypothetical protein [Reinekea sp.]
MNTENTNNIVEWAPFTLAEGVTEQQLLEAAETIESRFLALQPGYIRRELLKKSEQEWVDLVYWSSQEDAEQAFQKAAESEACGGYFSLMVMPENPETAVLHLQQMKQWR